MSEARPADQPARDEGAEDFAAPDHLHVAMENRHRSVGGGGARAAVFGISDGLVSNTSLVLGIAGAHAAVGVLRLAGLAGLLGGAFSMAAGEYVSMRAQQELFERELEIERDEILRWPEGERRELAAIYESRGIDSDVAHHLASVMMADPERALGAHAREELGAHAREELGAHAREELGIDPEALGSPLQAALASFVTFALGAAVPLAPFLAGTGTAAALVAVLVAGTVALVVGGVLAVFTGRSWWRSAFRELLICAAAGAVSFAIGSAVGASRIG
ncbi:MAG: VIT1/CCC1 transporter family protein [Acidimicrobiales bacterium]